MLALLDVGFSIKQQPAYEPTADGSRSEPSATRLMKLLAALAF